MAYDRIRAIEYAHKWAFDRNPRYLDFSTMGGDCTNFVSQCLLAGGFSMNYEKTFGWYYISASDRAPAWSGVTYLYNFLMKKKETGPSAREVRIEQIIPGDIVQLSFDGYTFGHSLLVVEAGNPVGRNNVLIATHTDDSDYRALNTYMGVREYRYLQVF